MITVSYIQIAIALTSTLTGNYAWEYVSGRRDWKRAHERSYFQVVSILIVFGFAIKL